MRRNYKVYNMYTYAEVQLVVLIKTDIIYCTHKFIYYNLS